MSFLAGMAGGFARAQAEHNKRQLESEQQRARSIAEMYGKLADDDGLSPELRNQYMELAHGAATYNPTDPKSRQAFKKLTKVNPSDLISAAHQQRQMAQQQSLQQNPAYVDIYDQSGHVDPIQQQRANRMAQEIRVPEGFQSQYPALAGQETIHPSWIPAISAQARGTYSRAGQPKAVKIDGQPGFAVAGPQGWMTPDGQPIQGQVTPFVPNSKLEEQAFVWAAKERELGRPLFDWEKEAAWREYNGSLAVAKAVSPTRVYEDPTPENPYGNVVIVPANQAYGKGAPQQVVGPTGQTSVGGNIGVGTTPIPPVNATTLAGLEGWEQALINARKAEKVLTDLGASIRTGPVWGRIKGVQLDQLGGWGTTPEERALAIHFNNIMSDRAFAEGGKNLTGTEYQIFLRKLPQDRDTLENALTKINDALNYAEERLSLKKSMIPERQIGAIPRYRNTPATEVEAPPNTPVAGEFVRDANGRWVLKPTGGK